MNPPPAAVASANLKPGKGGCAAVSPRFLGDMARMELLVDIAHKYSAIFNASWQLLISRFPYSKSYAKWLLVAMSCCDVYGGSR